MHHRKPAENMLWVILFFLAATFGFNACSDTNNVSGPNVAPVAKAGPDQGSIHPGTLVTLNGSASSDPNGNPLTYRWSFITRPPGSAAVLSSTTSVSPTFTLDRVGDYVVQLIVNDGTVNSPPDTVLISSNNVPPVANAGPDQGGKIPGALVTLNGNASSDGDGDSLRYSWSFTSKPAGSAAVLSSTTSVSPTFTVDRDGTYTVQLIVNDGTVNSPPDSVLITSDNVAPVANAGPNQGGKAPGSPITLNGGASSDANGDPLTYSWSFTQQAGGQRRGPGESHQRIADLCRRPRRQLCRATHCERWHGKRHRQRDHHQQQCRAGGQRRPRPRRQGPGSARHPRWQPKLRCQRGSAHVQLVIHSANRPAAPRFWRVPPPCRPPLPLTAMAPIRSSSSSTMAP